MKKGWQFITVVFLCLAFVLVGYPSVYAQEKKPEFTLEEIIVTAERRESSIMDTPLAVSAMDTDTLDQQNIEGVLEILMRVPGASFWGDSIYFRGIGRALTDLGSDPAVGIFYDGAYNEYTTRMDNMVDVERVETVRGPQSVMYGRNTIGGAVNIIFAKPTKEFSGQLKARIGNYDLREFTGIFSGPLIGDWLMGRVSFIDTYYGGDTKNLTYNTYTGTDDDWKAYFKLLFQPTDQFSMYFQYKVLWEGGNNSQEETSTLADDVTSPLNTTGNQLNQLYGTPQNPHLGGRAKRVSLANQTGFTKLDSKEVSLATDFTAGNFMIKHHMFYRWWYYWTEGDSDDGPSPNALYYGSSQLDTQEWSQDLQFLYGGADSRISLLGGLYYYFTNKFGRTKTYRDGSDFWEFSVPHDWSYPSYSAASVPGLTEAFMAVDGLTGFTPRLTNGRHETYYHSSDLENTSKSIYLNMDFDIIKNKLTFTLGGRYNIDEKDTTEDGELALQSSYGTQWSILNEAYREQNGITDTLETAGLDPVSNPEDAWPAHALGYYVRRPPVWVKYPYTHTMPQSISQDWDAYTWKTGADYRFSKGSLVYLNVSRGYKPGGLSISDSSGESFEYDAEYVVTYETGWKSRWLEDRMQTTLTLFYNNYTDKQQNFYRLVIDPISGEEDTESLVTNAGELESYGVEFEGSAYLTKQLRVSWQYSYLKAEYVEFEAYSSFTGEQEDIAGNPLPMAPENKINVQGTYTYPTDIGDFVLHAAYSWTDEVCSNFFARWYSWSKEWDRVDAELMWFSPDYKWRIALWGKNIMDQDSISFTTGSVDSGSVDEYDLTTYNVYYIDPFQFGIEVSYKW